MVYDAHGPAWVGPRASWRTPSSKCSYVCSAFMANHRCPSTAITAVRNHILLYIYIGVCDLLIKIQHYLLRSRWDTISLTPTGPTISRFRSSQPTAGPGGWGRPRLEIHRGQLMDRQLMDAIGHAARGRTRLAVLRAALHPRCFGQGFKGKPSAEHFTIFFIYGVPRIHGESHTMLRRTDATDGRGFINKVSHS